MAVDCTEILTPLCGPDGDRHIHVFSTEPFSPDDRKFASL